MADTLKSKRGEERFPFQVERVGGTHARKNRKITDMGKEIRDNRKLEWVNPGGGRVSGKKNLTDGLILRLLVQEDK